MKAATTATWLPPPPLVPAEAGRSAALGAIEELKTGAPIFVGPLKDNLGNVVIEGTLGLYDGSLWGTDYLIEGVVGSIT